MHLTAVDYVILVLYFAFVIGIGWRLRKTVTSAGEFLTAGHHVPVWITSLAFLAANLGAQEVVGMAASGAKYGIMTSHFYWIGAVPAMLFIGVFMMPFYYGSKARSVPEYLKMRFDEKTRGLNAITFAVMTLFSSGISMYALAKMFNLVLGWDFNSSIILSGAIVLAYTYLGGLTSAIYNEVLQFFLIVIGFSPLAILAVSRAGGWGGIQQRLPDVMTHAWKYVGHADQNPMGVEAFGLVAGLGFVLSFGYWCTDFLVVQRAMAANSMEAARRTPLIAAVPKMLFPALVILPGMIAIAMHHADGGKFLPLAADGTPDYNMTIPTLLAKYFPSGLLGIGFTALMASFMSGMAGNVTAFNTVWTYDIYQSYIARDKSDGHYLWMGRGATVFGILASIGAAILASKFNNIMDMLQLVFGFVNAPLFATFLLGMFWKRSTGHGAFFGLLIGTACAGLFHGLALTETGVPGIKGGWLAQKFIFHSEMGQNFWMAIVAWTACFASTLLISLATKRTKTDAELAGLVYSLTPKQKIENEPWHQRPAILGIVILIAALILNLIFA